MITISDVLEFLRSQRQPLPTRPRELPPAAPDTGGYSDLPMAPVDDYVSSGQGLPATTQAATTTPSTRPNRPLTTAAPRAPQAATEDAASPSPSPSPTLTPGVAATAQPRSPFELAPGDQSALDRLAAFGAALASTRSPTFQGAFGEGVQALMRQRQAQTQEARQQQQVDVEQEYRRAVVANQAAELAFARDPTNPLNILRRNQAEGALAEADLRRRQAANVGQSAGEGLGTGQVIRLRDGSTAMFYPGARGGPQIRPFPEGGIPLSAVGTSRRAEAADLSAIQRAGETAARLRLQEIQAGGGVVSPADIRRQTEEAAADARRRTAIERGVDPEIAGRFSAPSTTELPGNRVRVGPI